MTPPAAAAPAVHPRRPLGPGRHPVPVVQVLVVLAPGPLDGDVPRCAPPVPQDHHEGVRPHLLREELELDATLELDELKVEVLPGPVSFPLFALSSSQRITPTTITPAVTVR